MKINDKVFVSESWSGGSSSYHQGTVVKITPKGMIDVQIGAGVEAIRFNADGVGVGYNSRKYLDKIPFDERVTLLAQEQRAKKAANALVGIQSQAGINYCWGKEGLQTEITRLQDLLNAAKILVEAI